VSSLLLAAVRRLHLALSLVVQAVWMAPSADLIANVNRTEKTQLLITRLPRRKPRSKLSCSYASINTFTEEKKSIFVKKL